MEACGHQSRPDHGISRPPSMQFLWRERCTRSIMRQRSGPARAGPGSKYTRSVAICPKGSRWVALAWCASGIAGGCIPPSKRYLRDSAKVREQLPPPPIHVSARVDLNLDHHLAVCSVQRAGDGTILATSFIGNGAAVSGTRRETAWTHCTQPVPDWHHCRQ